MLRGVVILLSVVSLVKCSQSCWGCDNEQNIAVCRSNTVICGADEQCFVEKVVNDINELVYSAGCRSNAVCQIMQSLGSTIGKRSVVVCGQCCSGQNCQDTLCGGSTQGLVNGLTITLNKNAVRNSDLKIFISTSSITSAIILTKPDTSSDNCFAPLLGTGLCSTPDLTQDFTTNVTTYSISALVRSRDEGIWTAAHGVSDTNTINIKVLTIPTLNVAQTVSALTLSSSNTQTLTLTATCAYPAVSLVLYFVPTGGGTAVLSTLSTSSCTKSSSACADTDAQDYTCDIVPKLEASLSVGTYNMLVVVNLVGQYEPIGLNATITDTVITVKDVTVSMFST